MQRSICKTFFKKCTATALCHPLPHSLPFLQFLLFFSFINEIESCFSEQEIRSRSHSTGQSNREMTGATGNGYLQLLFIYLFRRYLVPVLKKGRKAIFIFLMVLPSTDNVPVLFPFSWISHATKCARNAKCCFVLPSRQNWNYSLLETKPVCTRNYIFQLSRCLWI